MQLVNLCSVCTTKDIDVLFVINIDNMAEFSNKHLGYALTLLTSTNDDEYHHVGYIVVCVVYRCFDLSDDE